MRRLIVPLLLAAAPATALAAEPIEGHWLTQGGRALVTIERCGKFACGRISRILIITTCT